MQVQTEGPDPDAIGVLIGRFQVDELHEGHVRLLDAVRRAHRRVVILLGVPPRIPNEDNPLTFPMRERMIRSLLPDAVILPVVDCRTDDEWSRQIDRLIESSFPVKRAVIYGGRKSSLASYKGRHRTQELSLGVDGASGTSARREAAMVIRDSPDFRAGVCHAMAMLPPRINPTVDIALVRPAEYWEVLLGKKPAESLHRFPGGHVDRTDESFEAAAKRELLEETGMSTEGDLIFLGSYMVPDWRGHDLTVFFAAQYSFGSAEARDDISGVFWLPITAATREQIVPEHQALFDRLRNHFTPKPIANRSRKAS